jgi:hypothetical protein
VLQVIFFAGYNVFDKWTMFHTAYLAWVVFMACGAQKLTEWVRPSWLVGILAVFCGYQLLAHWQSAGHFRDMSIEHKALTTLDAVPQNALLVGSWLSIRPIDYYQQVHGYRADVELYDFTQIGLAMRDKFATEPESVQQDAANGAIIQMIDCAEVPVYMVEVQLFKERYTMSEVLDGVFRVENRGECEA